MNLWHKISATLKKAALWPQEQHTALPFVASQRLSYLGLPSVVLPSTGYPPIKVPQAHAKRRNWLFSTSINGH